jgi:unsaturated rhamnogalacturonyl hydrolase
VSGLDAQKRDGSKEYYLSEEVVADDAKGVGPFMMAYAEYLSMPL